MDNLKATPNLSGTWKTDMSILNLSMQSITIYGSENNSSSLTVISSFPNMPNARLVLLTSGRYYISEGYLSSKSDAYEVVEKEELPEAFIEQIISQSMSNNKHKIVELTNDKIIVEGAISGMLLTSIKISTDNDTSGIRKYLNLL